MKKYGLICLIAILASLITIGSGYQNRSPSTTGDGQNGVMYDKNQQAAPTLVPTAEPTSLGEPTPTPRVLPPVGANAGLVIGASVLVLIIIGGVLSVRLRAKH